MEDSSLYFTDPTLGDDVTASAAGENATKSIPLGAVRNIGIAAHKLFIEAMVVTALTGAGDSVDVDLVTSSDAAVTQNVVPIKNTILQIPAVSAAGFKVFQPFPESFFNSAAFLQENLFLGVVFTARGSGNPGAGLVKVLLTLEPGEPHIYPTTSLV